MLDVRRALASLFWPALICAACQGLSSTPASKRAPAPVASSVQPTSTSTRVEPRAVDVEELTLVLAGRAPTDAERALAAKLAVDRPELTKQLVDGLLKDDGFSKDIAPRLLAGTRMLNFSAYVLPTNWALKRVEDGKDPVFYLRWAKQCTPKEAVAVEPWWEPGTKVRICPTSYRPEMFESKKTGKACDAIGPVMDEYTDCGCGPNLMRCLPDDATWKKVMTALSNETKATIAHLVAEDAPVQAVFSSNATARTRYAEAVYRRWLVEDQRLKEMPKLAELKDWPLDKPRWADRIERLPGEHAGILTDPNTAFSANGVRPFMRVLLDTLWCVGEESSNVETAVVLTLGREIRGADGSGAGAGWEKLAARPVCTNCHARLDYSARAWLGFPDVRVGTHFMAKKQLDRSGPMYVDNIDDKRGDMALNPAGWVRSAMAQPEFGACMTKKVISHVFADSGTEADARAVHDQFQSNGKLREMVRAAALRFVQRKLAERAAAAPQSSDLKALVVARCQDCHDYYEKSEPSLAELRKMHEVVYLRRMPKKGDLSTADRAGLMHALDSRLDNKNAVFFEHGYRSFAVHRPELMTDVIDKLTAGPQPADQPAKGPKARFIENGVDPSILEYTPGFALHISIAAVRACEKKLGAGADAKAVAQCARAATNERSGARSTDH